MKTRLLLAAVCAVVLGGCAHKGHFRAPDPTRPQVLLSPSGNLVVNQEPIILVLKKGEPNVITWRLPPDLTFDPKSGIRILGRVKNEKYEPIPIDDRNNSSFDCVAGDKPPVRPRAAKSDAQADVPNPQAFTCVVDPNIVRGIYAYEINALDRERKQLKLDPSVMPL